MNEHTEDIDDTEGHAATTGKPPRVRCVEPAEGMESGEDTEGHAIRSGRLEEADDAEGHAVRAGRVAKPKF